MLPITPLIRLQIFTIEDFPCDTIYMYIVLNYWRRIGNLNPKEVYSYLADCYLRSRPTHLIYLTTVYTLLSKGPNLLM